ncbi:MAG: mechanosensitive ion channel family protein [Chlamydiia bacterium]|nr:mechanosensitive ion channel family protein [Chlamydiia bacterium]
MNFGFFLTKSLGHWIAQVFLVVLISLVFDLVQKKTLNRVGRKLQGGDNIWSVSLFQALQRPLSFLIWIVGVAFAVEIIEKETQAPIFSAIVPIRNVGIIAILAWFLIRLVRNVQENIFLAFSKQKKSIDKTTAEALSKVVRASIVVTASLVMLQTLGFSISGVLAFGGIGGIAIGFAAKDLLANFFGGFMLYWDRPFKVGDWIRSPDREIEGTVEHIGWRLSRIRTFDKRPLYIPNSIFASISVENPSRMSHRRIHETIRVRYQDFQKLPLILKNVREMLQTHPEIDRAQTLMVNFNTFGESSLDFFVYTFTKTIVWTKYHHVKEDILLKIHDIIVSHGAEVAFPTSVVHLPEREVIEKISLKQSFVEKGFKETKFLRD